MEPNRTPEDTLVPPSAESSPEGDQVAPWEEIEDGRYMPRRVRGSCHGRELG
jgi:hypothetical protein